MGHANGSPFALSQSSLMIGHGKRSFPLSHKNLQPPRKHYNVSLSCQSNRICGVKPWQRKKLNRKGSRQRRNLAAGAAAAASAAEAPINFLSYLKF
jgi:hypothetical protein